MVYFSLYEIGIGMTTGLTYDDICQRFNTNLSVLNSEHIVSISVWKDGQRVAIIKKEGRNA